LALQERFLRRLGQRRRERKTHALAAKRMTSVGKV
jgi:hypothetical protein